MQLDKELTRVRGQLADQFRRGRSAGKPEVPQITIRGDNNLINLGTNGVVKVFKGGQPELPSGYPHAMLRGPDRYSTPYGSERQRTADQTIDSVNWRARCSDVQS